MDFKGMTWAGNIYQKFEAMCLEMEEVMYEDTAKYVENQVQKVGVSVKKFYAEVMQDLLPPSCEDPVKVAVGDPPPKLHAKTDLDKKPNQCISDMHGELKRTKIEREDVSNLTAEESSLSVCSDANRLSPLSTTVLVEYTHSDECPTKSKKVGVYKRPIGITKISKNNNPPKVSCARTSLSGDWSSLLACDIRSSCSVASDVRCDSGEAVTENTQVSAASVESRNSDQILSAESVRPEKNNPESTSLVSDKNLSDESPRQNKDDVESVGLDVITSSEDKFTKDGSLSQLKSNIDTDTCGVGSVGQEVIACCEDNFDIELIETEDVLEPRAEILAPAEKSRLEESCILVEAEKLHFVSQGTKTNKSYKKKIREALSSKLRSTRKQDQCVFQRENNDAGLVIPAHTLNCDKRKPPAPDSCESDWELL